MRFGFTRVEISDTKYYPIRAHVYYDYTRLLAASEEIFACAAAESE